MQILGAPSIHNPAWVLTRDGEATVSIEEDRLHRVKNRFGLIDEQGRVHVLAGLKYVLNVSGIAINNLDAIAFGFNPSATHFGGAFDVRLEHEYQERVFGQQALLLRSLRLLGYAGPVFYVRHHLAHAASVYFTSPSEDAAILTIDGWGEDETISICHGRRTTIRTLARTTLPHSIGEVYNVLTTRLGWGMDDAGKTMALAAFGHADASDESLIDVYSNEKKITVDTSRATAFVSALPQRNVTDPFTETHYQAAARIQAAVERALLQLAIWARKATGASTLCVSGGVALNCLANYRMMRESGFEKFFAQPACGDSGVPLGASLSVYYHLHPRAKRHVLTSPFLGRDYSTEEYRDALKGLPAQEFREFKELTREVGRLLSEGAVVGWFQGRSELGPRALGNRSIVADPRRADMKDRLNNAVKRRESFRPFAPSILEECVADYFEGDGASPFMLLAFPVRKHKLQEVPAISHIDGTARVQTVSHAINPRFYELIESFRAISGIPMILNTSFNIAGDPIVESPADAVDCFLRSGLNALAIGPFLIMKNTPRQPEQPLGRRGRGFRVQSLALP